MHRSPTKSWLWLLFGPVLAVSACSPSLAESTDKVEEEETIPLVRLSPVELRAVRREIETTGFLESEYRVTVLSKVPGRVLEVPVDVPVFHQMSSFGAALGAGAALGWWPRPGAGTAGDWPLPERYTIDPEPLDAYREGLDRFIALGDAAEASLQD